MSSGGPPVLRCATCGHLRIEHEHYRSGADCSHRGVDGKFCPCHRFTHPLVGWAYDVWERLMIRIGRG